MNDLQVYEIDLSVVNENDADNCANDIQLLVEKYKENAPQFFELLLKCSNKLNKVDADGANLLLVVLNEIANGKTNWIDLIVRIKNNKSLQNTLSWALGINF